MIFLLDLLLGSPVSVDNVANPLFYISLGKIVCCERSVILIQISWDQLCWLSTDEKSISGYSWDNYWLYA